MTAWEILIGNLTSVVLLISLWMHLQYKFYRLSKTQLKLGFGATLGLGLVTSLLLSVEFVPGVHFDLRPAILLTSAVLGVR